MMFYSPLLAYILSSNFCGFTFFLILYYFALELAYFFKLVYEMLSIISHFYFRVSSFQIIHHQSNIYSRIQILPLLQCIFPIKHHEFLLTYSPQKRVTLCSTWHPRCFYFLPKRIDYRVHQLLSHLPINKSMFSTP